MSLIINNNLLAANTAHHLTGHFGRLQTSIERLSSGLRVNNSADDAAGLAIRELMRSDIAALRQGARNTNDAISLIQTADGALGIIDEKLIRMKELAEQAATGTYNSTQRLMIDSEFQAMGAEIDRIARSTDFNGIKLLDGSRSGIHNGSTLTSTGALKIHFGTGNDSAEDYYYLDIADCTTKGLGLWNKTEQTVASGPAEVAGELRYEDVITYPPYSELNDYKMYNSLIHGKDPFDITTYAEGQWYCGIDRDSGDGSQNTMLLIKKGTKNFVLNEIGSTYGTYADNDIQLFTTDGKHLAGRTPLPDYSYKYNAGSAAYDNNQPTDLASNCERMGFAVDQYDASSINAGARDQNNGATMNFTTYNGMLIGYSGDGPVNYDNIARYEVLYIDEAKEDLIVWMPGVAGAVFKYYTSDSGGKPVPSIPPANAEPAPQDTELLSIKTQETAQKALERIDDAIIVKDQVRANLGAMQNRLENTVTNISIQAENLQAAESRISDANIAQEMSSFVRNQILSQSATAMLGQANSVAQIALKLIGG